MIYYKNSDISLRLAINLAKWKRWVRDFLPPDPLGGKQSGYARQLSIKDAFLVYFGGVLVSELRYAVAEASRILSDLTPWLKKNGYFKIHLPQDAQGDFGAQDFSFIVIYIFHRSDNGFCYTIRKISSIKEVSEKNDVQENYGRIFVNTDSDPLNEHQVGHARIVGISKLYHDFLYKLVG
jgi:hypothetical protein